MGAFQITILVAIITITISVAIFAYTMGAEMDSSRRGTLDLLIEQQKSILELTGSSDTRQGLLELERQYDELDCRGLPSHVVDK